MDVVAYCAVDDVGTIINPLIVHGQVHGGVAQGIGQVLLERIAYDDDGQLITGSLMDYAPSKTTLEAPRLQSEWHRLPFRSGDKWPSRALAIAPRIQFGWCIVVKTVHAGPPDYSPMLML